VRQGNGGENAPPGPDALYQLRITLQEMAPPIWRRVQVPARFTLAQLHRVLQAAFGWQDCHLFSFEHGDTTYSDAETVAGFGEGREARRTRVHQVVRAAGERMTYTYDFGDGWEHDVVLEAILSPDPGERHATLLDGERAGPPEDCGGSWGFADLLYALDDPEHEGQGATARLEAIWIVISVHRPRSRPDAARWGWERASPRPWSTPEEGRVPAPHFTRPASPTLRNSPLSPPLTGTAGDRCFAGISPEPIGRYRSRRLCSNRAETPRVASTLPRKARRPGEGQVSRVW
jgi:hypothetical protein